VRDGEATKRGKRKHSISVKSGSKREEGEILIL
jgi:hypothetical protein